jgi:5-methylcytosine-specific restriction enzyme subunit McrC
MAGALRRPWEPYLPWHYDEHTADIDDNRIVAWTLHLVSRSGLCHEDASRNVRRANHLLQSATSLEPFAAADCVGRLYHRMNEDYEALHALCRFFLEHCGPLHQTGDNSMLPFQVDVSILFEQFVAAWLQTHLPEGLALRPQQTVSFTGHAPFRFRIDLVLYDHATDQPVCVMDTKYKVADGPSESDIQQVVAYAHSLGCHEALLIYPQTLSKQLDTMVGQTHVRGLAFPLDGDLEAAGLGLLEELASLLAYTAAAPVA